MAAMPGPDRLIRVSADPIDPNEALAFVADPAAGATCLFTGTVRDHSEAGTVRAIAYEAWDELAAARLGEIADELFATWPLQRVALVHRHGDLEVGQASVAVAVSAAHRAEAFEACRHAIERLKHDVPIWKKEMLADGEGHWVMGA
jgi:molybdopterin synthase catalytic subunit